MLQVKRKKEKKEKTIRIKLVIDPVNKNEEWSQKEKKKKTIRIKLANVPVDKNEEWISGIHHRLRVRNMKKYIKSNELYSQ